MLDVKGFRAYRYDKQRVGSLDNVVTPPWDVISPDARKELAARSPYNLIRVKLPEIGPDGHPLFAEAGLEFASWIEAGVLRQDDAESFYLLEQEFADMEGRVHVRRGFFAAVRVPETGERTILGHERTFPDRVRDRVQLTEAARANLGAIFVLYADPENALAGFLGTMDTRPPDDTAHTIDGVTQRLWRVPADPAVTAFFRGKRLYIADGHHRYLTACVHRDRMHERERPTEPQPYDYVLMGLVAFRDPGLMIYPPHRLLRFPAGFDAPRFLEALEPWFDAVKVDGRLAERVRKHPSCAIGLSIHGAGDYLLVLRNVDRADFLGTDHSLAWRNLDVAVLHRGIIERILKVPADTAFEYEHNPERAIASVRDGAYGLAFLLRPMQAEDVRACADADDPMPQKATYFFPKLPSGAVIHRLEK